MVIFLFLGVFFSSVLLCLPFVEVTGVLAVSSSSDEESSDELLSALGVAACGFFAGGVFTVGVLAGCSSSSELLSLEDEDSAGFLAGVFAAEVGVFTAAFALATAALAGVFLGSVSESELSDDAELLLSAFFALAGVETDLAGVFAALGVEVVFTSSSSELSESLLLDSAAGFLAGAGGLATGAELTAILVFLAAGVSSSELLSDSELLSAGFAAGLDVALAADAGLAGVTAGLDFGVVTAFF